MTEYNGYELFENCDDAGIRSRNRAVVMYNILSDNMKDGKISHGGLADLLTYTRMIPLEERADAVAKFRTMTANEGNA